MILSHDLISFCCWKIRVSRRHLQKSFKFAFYYMKYNSFWPTYAVGAMAMVTLTALFLSFNMLCSA